MAKVYLNDANTDILLDCGIDVTAAQMREISVLKPNGDQVEWPAFLSGTNLIGYTTNVDTFDMAGSWRLQAHVIIGQGEWRGETATLTVYAPFN
jgi:hypothetical protein